MPQTESRSGGESPGVRASVPASDAAAPALSLVIPIFNEAEHIERNVGIVVEYLERRPESFEVVLADDGSTDGTKEILRRLVATGSPSLRLVENPENRGKGSVLSLGLTAARGEVRGFLDADLEIDVRFVGDLLDRLDEEVDVCVGSRAVRGSAERSRLRHLAHHAYNAIVRAFLGTTLRDNSSGIKFFRREVVETVVPEVEEEGWGWDVECVVRCQMHGFRVREVPIETVEQRLSKVRVFATALQTLRMIFRLYRQGVRVRRGGPRVDRPRVPDAQAGTGRGGAA